MQNEELLRKRFEAIHQNPKDGIHDVRVLTKILRAGLRYYDAKLKKYKDLDRSLGDSARQLSVAREAEARRELLEWLEKKGIRVPVRTTATTAPKELETDGLVFELAGKLHQVFDELHKRRSDQAEEAWKRLQKALKNYHSDPSVENLHALRKKSKCLEYQLMYFSSDQRQNSIAHENLHCASQKLGRAHDLDALVKEVNGHDRELLCEILKDQKKVALQRLGKLNQLNLKGAV